MLMMLTQVDEKIGVWQGSSGDVNMGVNLEMWSGRIISLLGPCGLLGRSSLVNR